MRIEDIKIFECFRNCPPGAEKMQGKEAYYLETGAFQSDIVLDGAGNLIDGYTSYLLAVKYGVGCVPVRYGRRQIIRAAHKAGGKLFTWELPGLLIGRVCLGDKVTVYTQRGIRSVIVAAVEEYAGEDIKPLKMAIRIRRRARKEAAA